MTAAHIALCHTHTIEEVSHIDKRSGTLAIVRRRQRSIPLYGINMGRVYTTVSLVVETSASPSAQS